MLFRRAALIVTVILVLGTLGLALWFWKSQNRLYSSPTAIRTNETYLRAHAPATNRPATPSNPTAGIQVERTTNGIQLRYATRMDGSSELDYEPLQVHRADGSQIIPLENGSIRLAYVLTALPIYGTNLHEEGDIRVRGNLYTSDLKAVSTNESVPELPEWERNLSLNGDFPVAKFVFASSNLNAIKPLKFSAFDARTQFSLMQGYGSSSPVSNVFWFSADLSLWHQTPVEVLATVATGPTRTYSLAPKEGAKVEYPGGAASVLIVSDTDLSGFRGRYDGRTNIMTIQPRNDSWTARQGPTCSFLLHFWPKAANTGIDIEFINADGEKISTYRSSTSAFIYMASVKGVPEDVKEIRLIHYPNVHRLVFTLPELPGLPEENRNLKNLFDVHVPFIFFRYEYAFQNNIASLVQMEHQSAALTYPNGFFPTFRTNTDARALFQELESKLSDKDLQLHPEPRANKITPRLPPALALLKKVKAKLGVK